MAEGATIANAFVQIMPSMEGATDSITSAILPGVGNAGTKAGAKFSSMFSGKMGSMLKGLGAAAVGYLGFSALKDTFTTVEAGFNNVILATGATGESADALKQTYLDVAGSVVGSFEDIGSALGELNTRFGLEGKALQTATQLTMKYAKVTGQDATSAVSDVASMMNNAGISAEDYETVLDQLTVASQASGISTASLAKAVNANATTMKEMGLSTEDTIAMLANFEKTGADTSSILAAMKKGVQNWTKEGKNAKEGFADFVSGVEDGSITAQDAIEIFGSKGGLAMYDAAQKGQLSFDAMYDAIVNDSAGALDSVYQSTLTAQEKFDMLGNKLQAGIYKVLEPIVDAIMPYMDDIIDAVAGGINWFVKEAVPRVKEAIKVISSIVSSMKTTVTNVVSFWKDVPSKIANYVQKMVDRVKAHFQKVADFGGRIVDKIAGFWSYFPNKIAQFVRIFVDRAKGVFQGIVDFAGSLPGKIANFWSSLPDKLWSIVSTAASWVKDVFWGIVDYVAGIPGQIVSWFWGLGDRITAAIGDIHFPIPQIGGYTYMNILGTETYLPQVYWWGHGGYLDQPVLFGAGERGGEFIWPSYEPYLSQYAEALASKIGANGVDIHDCTFVVRKDSDIRAVAYELNELINRQTAGGLA